MQLTEDQLGRLTRAVRAAVLEKFSPDSCIASSRVLIDVLRSLGVLARPVAVRTVALNAEAFRLFAEDVPVENWPPTAHSVGVAATGEKTDGRWDGHLVVVSGDWLIDPSADQMSRPGKNLVLDDPLVMPLYAPFTKIRVWKNPDTGVILGYEPVADTQYRNSRNWDSSQGDIQWCVTRALEIFNEEEEHNGNNDQGSRAEVRDNALR
jgi:hypothetical protein